MEGLEVGTWVRNQFYDYQKRCWIMYGVLSRETVRAFFLPASETWLASTS